LEKFCFKTSFEEKVIKDLEGNGNLDGMCSE